MSQAMIGLPEEFSELVAMSDDALERIAVMDRFGANSWSANYTLELQYCVPDK